MKHETRIDTRTVRTKEKILATLKEMILELDYDEITVSELMKRAELHRKTFYLHHDSLENAFMQIEDDIVKQLEQLCIESFDEKKAFDFDFLPNGFAELLSRNEALHKRLFCTDSYYFIFNHIKQRSCDFFFTFYLEHFDIPADELDTKITFAANGMLAVWRKWYIAGLNPAEEFSKYNFLRYFDNSDSTAFIPVSALRGTSPSK